MAPRFEYAHCRPCRMVMHDMPTNRAASTFGTLRFTWISMQNNHLVSSRQRDTPALPLPAGVLLFDDTARVSHLLALVSRARAFLARLWYRQPQIMAIVFSTNPPPRHPPRLVRLDSSSTPRRSKHGRKKGRTSDLVQTPTSNGPHPLCASGVSQGVPPIGRDTIDPQSPTFFYGRSRATQLGTRLTLQQDVVPGFSVAVRV